MEIKNGEYKVSVEGRLSTVEAEIRELRGELKHIRDNHLKHLGMKMNWLLGLFITLLFTIIGALIAFI
jgi:hypothetical protein|tara:strand:- start:116 stop:319 length:204 start_codon:yes stop_codon:yes gene_type:complete